MAKIKAPFRWAGSKAKVASELLDNFQNADVYIEPFLGGGTVLIRLLQEKRYSKYIVNDINVSVASFYKELQHNPTEVVNTLLAVQDEFNGLPTMEDKREYFLNARVQFNEDKSNYALFWLMMKAGFNGLYRENKKGQFNGPYGKKEKINLNVEELLEIADLIRSNDVTFYNLDYREFYEEVERQLEGEVFAYNDPPYCQSQDYTAEKFDNRVLADTLKDKPYPLGISDVDSEESNTIYQAFNKRIVSEVKRVIQISAIKTVTEVLYCNY